MPRVGSGALEGGGGGPSSGGGGGGGGGAGKPLPSLVDEIEAVLAALAARLHPNMQRPAPCVRAWLGALGGGGAGDGASAGAGSGDGGGDSPSASSGGASAGASSGASAGSAALWAGLPPAVDAGSLGMGLSTRLSAKKRAKAAAARDEGKVAARVARKRWQVESFLAVLRPLLEDTAAGAPGRPPPRVVDFGCGTGNLLLPLAALFPGCAFTGVDMKPAALALLRERAAAAGLRNVSAWEGMIERFDAPFDVALALHACGNATDHVLALAAERRAAFVVSPCCVGKLKFSMTGGSSFHSRPVAWTPSQPGDAPVRRGGGAADGGSSAARPAAQAGAAEPGEPAGPAAGVGADVAARLQHPRSCWLRRELPDPEAHFRTMARVADIAHAPADQAALGAALAARAAVADSCKRFVELDRCAAAAEAGFAVGLFKVIGAEAMAKNDLLVGVPCGGAGARDDLQARALVARGLLLTAAELGLA
ncbi:hypothetical protein HT031_002226 [Scenedesmus sp. PABB004]|nr:hypothetical protein HT031_002226 [Scenedesmus sp. PABB004]